MDDHAPDQPIDQETEPELETPELVTSVETTTSIETIGLAPGMAIAADHETIKLALLERPWAIKRSVLSLMARTGAVPPSRVASDVVGMSNFERSGGYMAGSVAVLPLYGFISHRASFWSWLFGGTSVDLIRATVRDLVADQSVSAVILDVDSPGGSVDGVTELAADLRAMRGSGTPIVAVANTLMASCAYWIGSQVDELVSAPSGEVGSVGVYALHEDDSGYMEQLGIKMTFVSAGDFKTEGNPYEPLTDEARAAMQAQVDAFYGMFVSDVAKGRSVSAAKVLADYGQGRTLLAKPALAAGMVDRIDTLEATVRRLAPVSRGRRSAAVLEGLVELAVADLGPPETPVVPAVAAAASSASHLQPDRAWNSRMKGLLRT